VSNALPQYSTYVSSAAPWLGDTPSSWRTLRGKFVFHEIQERSELGDETLLSVSEYYGVKPRGETIEEGEFLSRAESLIGYKKCGVDDLAVNIMLAWKKGLGVSRFSGIVSPSYAVFRFGHVAAPEYMHYLLRTDLYADHFRSRSTGIMDSRLRLYPDSFRDIEILLPSLGEQTQIARFLDYETAKIDRLIDKQQQLIALLKEKRQAVISHAVTKGLNPNAPMKDSGVEWLGQVPAHWHVRRAKYLFDFVTSGSRGWAEHYSDEGELFFRITNLTRDTIEPKLASIQNVLPPAGSEGERSRIRVGDILISITADLGSVCVADTSVAGGYVSQHVCLSRPGAQVRSSRWLGYFVLCDAAKEQLLGSGYGGTKVQLSLEDIRELVTPIPPPDEQLEISRFLDERLYGFEILTTRAEAQVELLQERRTALISAAVTGKIDVRGWTPPDSDEEAQQVA